MIWLLTNTSTSWPTSHQYWVSQSLREISLVHTFSLRYMPSPIPTYLLLTWPSLRAQLNSVSSDVFSFTSPYYHQLSPVVSYFLQHLLQFVILFLCSVFKHLSPALDYKIHEDKDNVYQVQHCVLSSRHIMWAQQLDWRKEERGKMRGESKGDHVTQTKLMHIGSFNRHQDS